MVLTTDRRSPALFILLFNPSVVCICFLYDFKGRDCGFDLVQNTVPVSKSQFGPRFNSSAQFRQLLVYRPEDMTLRFPYLFRRNIVQGPSRHGNEGSDLLGCAQGLELSLFQDFPDSPPALQNPAGALVETRPETRERFQFLKLRIRQTKISSHGT